MNRLRKSNNPNKKSLYERKLHAHDVCGSKANAQIKNLSYLDPFIKAQYHMECYLKMQEENRILSPEEKRKIYRWADMTTKINEGWDDNWFDGLGLRFQKLKRRKNERNKTKRNN